VRSPQVMCYLPAPQQRNMQKRKPGVVRWIGVFRLIKAILLLGIGLGALKFLHKDLGLQIQEWFSYWQVDPDNRYLRSLVSKVSRVDDRNLVLMSVGTFFYAGLFLVEGIGLLLLKRWAEIFTVIVTASFIPLEIYHLTRQFSVMKIMVILVNTAIVVYLLWRLRHESTTKRR